ncbi:hypothetical protein PGTUg99_050257 [Puccinia graminis f. sp. tritici]|uniref:Uncharacterized protein n=1 Tax=Puccinia graminis f. sp. tritici TaxID=56615 RepID=A0A5B0Q428_PUCGR|nr:hypothetical protein PGTUg99_050257 [Puccinia graminis f. sp. tritici]
MSVLRSAFVLLAMVFGMATAARTDWGCPPDLPQQACESIHNSGNLVGARASGHNSGGPNCMDMPEIPDDHLWCCRHDTLKPEDALYWYDLPDGTCRRWVMLQH